MGRNYADTSMTTYYDDEGVLRREIDNARVGNPNTDMVGVFFYSGTVLEHSLALQCAHNGYVEGEHSIYSVAEWKVLVRDDVTRHGYWEWVALRELRAGEDTTSYEEGQAVESEEERRERRARRKCGADEDDAT
jgi:hypothetical protein